MLNDLIKQFRFISLVSCLLLISFYFSGCATPRPKHVSNVCSIFIQYPTWYWATQEVEARWKVPITVQMAILHQESRFTADAKPPRTKLLWVIPWKRPTSAYGYTQALKSTWEHYQRSRGNSKSRDEFSDAVDFIGWYSSIANKRAGIQPNDPYRLYLAYHEGVGGYIKQTYKQKPWLVNVARKVTRQTKVYDQQLRSCITKLPQKPWYRFW